MKRRKTSKKPATTIPLTAYPQIAVTEAMRLLRALRDPKIAHEAACIIANKADDLRHAVLAHLDRMEKAALDFDVATMFEQAHEIRGLAGNAGLSATGRIANVLCTYLDATRRMDRPPDRTLVALHLELIARAAHAEDEATRLGDTVANELAALVERKLAETGDLQGR